MVAAVRIDCLEIQYTMLYCFYHLQKSQVMDSVKLHE